MPKKLLENEETDERNDQKIIIPKRKPWWLFIFIPLLALAVFAGWYAWTKQAKTVATFAECKAAGGAILESFPEQCAYNGKNYTNPDQTAPEPEVVQEQEQPAAPEPKLASYSDTANGFSIQYPADFVQTEKEVATPYTAAGVPVTSQNFTHSIPVEYCNLKGDCVPNTTDISFALSVVNSSIEKIAASPKIGKLSDVTFGENSFQFVSQGAEGEGIFYYFIALPNKKTLMVSRTYLDETVLSKYQTAKDFITKSDQDKLIVQILSSLSITPTKGTAN